MGQSKPFGAVHVVTAGEAAMSYLHGHFSMEKTEGTWGMGWPLIYKPWPLRLHAFYAEVLTSGNMPKHGIPVWLYALWRPTDAFGLASEAQGWSKKAQWAGNLYCEHGFGVMTRTPAVVAGDLIVVGGMYEPL